MEKVLVRYFIGAFILMSLSCSSLSYLKYDKEDKLRQNEEFDREVVIKEVVVTEIEDSAIQVRKNDETDKQSFVDETLKTKESEEASHTTPSLAKNTPAKTSPAKSSLHTDAKNQTTTQSQTTTAKADTPKGKTSTVSKAQTPVKDAGQGKAAANSKVATKAVVNQARQPTIEDAEGFENGSRRPIKVPFVVGEKIVHSVSYFGAVAGRLTMETKSMLEVNGRLSYNFFMGLKTSRLFSNFYSVDDYVETYVDYENLVPHVYKMNMRESGKLSQSHAYFDNKTLRAKYWEKLYTKKNGEEEKKFEWDILPYSQNAFSGLYYLRIFQYKPGRQYSFRVADNKKNIIFKADVIGKEKLNTDAGRFDAIKFKATIESHGILTQSGDIHIWVSDDDRKIILRIEAGLKIGKLVSEIVEYESGRD